MNSEQMIEQIRKAAKKTLKEIKALQDENGDFKNPIDMDMVKTHKAMFFEEVLEILRSK